MTKEEKDHVLSCLYSTREKLNFALRDEPETSHEVWYNMGLNHALLLNKYDIETIEEIY